MTIYGIEINLLLLITLICVFLLTMSLTFAINKKRGVYLEEIDEFKKKLKQIRENITNILEENERYKEENYRTNQRIQDLEGEYERKYQEDKNRIEEENKIELEKQKQRNQKAMEDFSNSKEIWEYFADLFSRKLQEGKK